MARAVLAAGLVVLFLVVLACSGPHDSPAPACAKCTDSGVLPVVGDASVLVDGAARQQYIANASDFDGFRGWQMFDLGEHPEGDAIHLPGPRKVYINKLPPKGSTTFPVGTLIVKTVQADQWQVFGLAKRGASFNPFGALDWEWFGLSFFDNGVVNIEWRGTGPPAGAGYNGAGTCNNCHMTAHDNDYVMSDALLLSRL